MADALTVRYDEPECFLVFLAELPCIGLRRDEEAAEGMLCMYVQVRSGCIKGPVCKTYVVYVRSVCVQDSVPMTSS